MIDIQFKHGDLGMHVTCCGKLAFVITGRPGRYNMKDNRPHSDFEYTFHTIHAALCFVLDELVPEGT